MKSINLREIDRSGQDVARILYQRAYATRAVYDVPNRWLVLGTAIPSNCCLTRPLDDMSPNVLNEAIGVYPIARVIVEPRHSIFLTRLNIS